MYAGYNLMYGQCIGSTQITTRTPTAIPSTPTVAPSAVPSEKPTIASSPTLSPSSVSPSIVNPTLFPTTLSPIVLGSYEVTTVFGTGRATTTDSPGLIGEINHPMDSVFDSTENYLYLTDQNGGGLIRKLAVTSTTWDLYTRIYSVMTVFTGSI